MELQRAKYLSLVAACVVPACVPAPSVETRQASAAAVRVVACVMGYQVSRQLPDGRDVPSLTLNREEAKGAGGIQFQVLSPTNFEGNCFWLHHDGFLASGHPAELYAPDKLYTFTINSSDMKPIPHAGCSLRPLGWEVTSTDVVEAEFTERRGENVRRLRYLEKELQGVSKGQGSLTDKEREQHQAELAALRAQQERLDAEMLSYRRAKRTDRTPEVQ